MASTIQRATNLQRSGKPIEALRMLKDICAKQPNYAKAWFLQGMLQAQQKNYPDAEHCIRRSIELQPGEPGAHRALGDILAMRRNFIEAITAYRASLSFNPKQTEIYTNLSQCMRESRRIPEAIEAGLVALKMNPTQRLTNRNLGLLYEQLHRTDEARKHALAELELNSGDTESHILLAMLDNRAGDHSASMQRLQKQLDRRPPPLQQAMLHLKFAETLDKLGDFQTAFQHLTSGKALLGRVHSITRQSTAAYRAEIEQYSSYFTPDRVKQWLSESPQEQHTSIIFLVGFPRSGTTLTEQILESHDAVVASDELPIITDIIKDIASIIGKTFNYPADMGNLTRVDIKMLRETYMEKLAQGLNTSISKDTVILDKLPLNIVHLGFIARIFPEARILVSLRDPRDVCLSCYMQAFDINPAMAQFLNIEDTGKFYACVMKLWMHYRSIKGMQVLETRYEDIVDDPAQAARRLLDFCGLQWDDKVLDFHTKAKQRHVRTPSYQAVAKPVYSSSVNRWQNYSNELQELMPSIEPYIDAFGYLT